MFNDYNINFTMSLIIHLIIIIKLISMSFFYYIFINIFKSVVSGTLKPIF